MEQLFDIIFNIDEHLVQLTTDYQKGTYLILAVIIFCETGLVITPFLPGDSLIFSAGAVAAMQGSVLNIFLLTIIILSAALIGDTTNYWLGRMAGKEIYEKNYRLISRKKLLKTKSFYEKYGALTIILGRYMPVIRTFTPFIAGVAPIKYSKFLSYSLTANMIWVNLYSWTGYYFGNLPFVQRNFEYFIFGILMSTFIPPIWIFVKNKIKNIKKAKSSP